MRHKHLFFRLSDGIRTKIALGVLLSGGSTLVGCSSGGSEEPTISTVAKYSSSDESKPEKKWKHESVGESEHALYEAAAVRPIALSPKGYVAVTNTPNDSIEIFKPRRRGTKACASIHVGVRPVAAAWVGDDIWVVNHLSDSVSVVRFDDKRCRGYVARTLQVGDEPRDIVAARNEQGRQYVFVTAAHRGQNVLDESGQFRDPELTVPGVGRADVFVYDSNQVSSGQTDQPLKIINLFTDVPRALAVGDHKVYAAGFLSGNQTAVIRYQLVIDKGRKSYRALDSDADFQIDDGAEHFIEGGYPAVRGNGRCISAQTTVSPLSTNDFIMDVCVETAPDDPNRPIAIHPQVPGEVTPTCSCTNAIGELQRSPPLIVRFYESEEICGSNYAQDIGGCWLEPPRDDQVSGLRYALSWNEAVPFSLPDKDVFTIDLTDEPVLSDETFRQVGTTLFSLAVHPRSGQVFVGNLEARNHVRFEGPGESEEQSDAHGNTTVRGHVAESRVTVLDPDGRVKPVHLNDHIDYTQCCAPSPNDETERSLAFPVSLAISNTRDRRGRPHRDQDLYLAALGSDKVAVLNTRKLDRARPGRPVQDKSDHIEVPGGPVGLALDDERERLYVLARFSNDLVVIDTDTRKTLQRIHLTNPEPQSVVNGRRFLYDARSTSSHGDTACFSCHIYGDLDGLAWDLGDPNSVEVENLGPFFSKPEILSAPLTSHFLALKGPMTTQSLRGMANHGAMHWRGDRRSSDPISTHPDSGAFDEVTAFTAFNVAFPGLTGRAEPLSEAEMTKFTDFILQVMYPPNPIRALDDSLTEEQKRARNRYFGCTISDESMAQGLCADGRSIEEETLACNCANPPRFFLGLEPLPDYCNLEISDFQNTCHGCHTLDPDGNSEFDVAKPGFFGTSGVYTNDAVAHILKVPHLRNMYQKVGMFGSYNTPEGIGLTSITDSVLGVRRGGLLASQNRHMGDQVRGFGFTHAGEEDSIFHFFSLTGFVRSPAPSPLFPNDNAAGFEPVLPWDAQTCFENQLPSLNGAFLSQLGSPAELQQLGAWLATLNDSDATPEEQAAAVVGLQTFILSLPEDNPGSVFQLVPFEQALGQLALPLFACGSLPDYATLSALGCFDLHTGAGCEPLLDVVRGCSLWGATLEEVIPNGTQACISAGIVGKADMESFVFAFDNNVKPIVGQQVTVNSSETGETGTGQDRLALLVAQTQMGNADLVASGPKNEYVYHKGKLLRGDGRLISMSDALEHERVLTYSALAPGEGVKRSSARPHKGH